MHVPLEKLNGSSTALGFCFLEQGGHAEGYLPAVQVATFVLAQEHTKLILDSLLPVAVQ